MATETQMSTFSTIAWSVGALVIVVAIAIYMGMN